MSEKLEQIKELQKDLFVEEYGVTKEQAKKLTGFTFHESVGEEFNFWQGQKVQRESINVMFSRHEREVEVLKAKLSKLEKRHEKLCRSSNILGITVVVYAVIMALVQWAVS